MEDIRRVDRKLCVQELLAPGRLFLSTIALACISPFLFTSGPPFTVKAVFTVFALGVVGVHVNSALKSSLRRRFHNRRFEALWNACRDRYRRYEEVLARMRKDQIADFQEMPHTIRRIAESLYVALRRADIISHEVMETEKGLYSQPANWNAAAHDDQARKLYQIADKNIAEYRQHFSGVMAGVQRTEAQAAVYMTTLDTLRMKMIGYRLVGKAPELSSDEFLSSLHEAKLQLMAIDRALEELDFLSIPPGFDMPPPVPAEAFHDIEREIR